jgi:hypothetical protein
MIMLCAVLLYPTAIEQISKVRLKVLLLRSEVVDFLHDFAVLHISKVCVEL